MKIFLLFLLLAPLSVQAQSKVDCETAYSTPEINDCLASDAEIADKELNETYRAVIQRLASIKNISDQYDESRKNLIEAQRAWIIYKDKNCDAIFAYWKDGTIRTAMYEQCQIDLTKQRTEQLKEFLD